MPSISVIYFLHVQFAHLYKLESIKAKASRIIIEGENILSENNSPSLA